MSKVVGPGALTTLNRPDMQRLFLEGADYMTDEITPKLTDDKPLPPRGERDPAPEDQLVAYIVVDRSYVRHRTYAAAKREREYLKAKTGKPLRILKILQCDHADLTDGKIALVREGKIFEVPTE